MICEIYYDISLPIFVFFIIGLIIGLIIFIPICIFCLKLRCKNKRAIGISNEEKGDEIILIEKSPKKVQNYIIDLTKIINTNTYERKDNDTISVKKTLFYSNFDFKKYHTVFGNNEKPDFTDLLTSDIILHEKDVRYFYNLDLQYMNDRLTGHMQLQQQLFNLLYSKDLISKEELGNLKKRNSEKYKQEIDKFNEYCQEFKMNIKNTLPKKSQPESERESEIEMKVIEELPAKADILINKIIHSQSLEAQEVIQETKAAKIISEEDANKILKIYSQNSQSLEERLKISKKNSLQKLEERLKIIDVNLKNVIIEDNINKNKLDQRKEIMIENTLSKFENLSQSDRNQILKEYNDNVNEIRLRREEESKNQIQKLSEKMNELRSKEIDKVFNDRSDDLKKIIDGSMKCPLDKRKDFMKDYHRQEDNLDNEIAYILSKIDVKEMNEYVTLKNKIDKSINTEIDELEQTIIKNNCEKYLINSVAYKSIMIDHQKNLFEIQSNLEKEKKNQIEKLSQILNDRKTKISVDLETGIQAQIDEEKKQKKIFKMTLENQLNLPQDLKNEIIEEGKADAISVSNQLVTVKLRQQKLLELALAKRLKSKNDVILKSNSDVSVQKNNEIDKYCEIVKQIEQEKSSILLETREKLINETAAALKQREEFMANIMAKYTLSHARTMKAKKNCDILYENLLNAMNKKTSESLSASQIMDKFRNEKDYIENQRKQELQKQKEQVEKKLKERQEQMKGAKTSELEKQYLETLKEFEKSGVSQEAVDFVDSRFVDEINRSIEENEKEIKKEFEEEENIKEIINENNFDKTIKNKINETLSKLVAISNMSKEDLLDLINQINPKIDEATKYQVIRDLYKKQKRDSLKIPQLELNNQEKENTFMNSQRYGNQIDEGTRNDYDDSNYDDSLYRHKKSKKKKKRTKNLLDDGYDENGF